MSDAHFPTRRPYGGYGRETDVQEPVDPSDCVAQRLAAAVIDMLIWGPAVIIVMKAGFAAAFGWDVPAATRVAGSSATTPVNAVPLVLTFALLFAIHFGYSWIFPAKWGATPGMWVMGLRVVRRDGNTPITWGESAVRAIFWVFLDNMWIALIAILATKGHRRIGDLVCNTNVIPKRYVGRYGELFPPYGVPPWEGPAPMYAPPQYGYPAQQPYTPPARTAMSDALFVRDAGGFRPTEFATGPWDPNALHGGPVAGLAGNVLEDWADPELMVARLTLELIRPVPKAPLAVELTPVREGRTLALVDLRISAGDVDVVMGRAVLLRCRPIELPVLPDELIEPPLPVDEAAPMPLSTVGWTAFHTHGTSIHSATDRGGTDLGPERAWFRLHVPVVEGYDPTPLERTLCAADFGNGVSAAIPFADWSFVNPDLTVVLHRYPVGEWVCLDAVSRLQGSGIGSAESLLWDTEGPIGRAVQTLVITPR